MINIHDKIQQIEEEVEGQIQQIIKIEIEII